MTIVVVAYLADKFPLSLPLSLSVCMCLVRMTNLQSRSLLTAGVLTKLTNLWNVWTCRQ